MNPPDEASRPTAQQSDVAPPTPSRREGEPDGAHLASHRHWLGFLVSGGLAFTTDALVLEAGMGVLGLGPYAARGLAISVAMLVGWLAHRRLTFAISGPPRLAELARYVTAAWMAASVNYVLYAAALILRPSTRPFSALVAASAAAMLFSYAAMRYAVFRRNRDPGFGR